MLDMLPTKLDMLLLDMLLPLLVLPLTVLPLLPPLSVLLAMLVLLPPLLLVLLVLPTITNLLSTIIPHHVDGQHIRLCSAPKVTVQPVQTCYHLLIVSVQKAHISTNCCLV